MRALLALLHRWLGLFTAVFLLIAGLTGAVIAWDHELDEWLNPDLFKAHSEANEGGEPLSPFALAARVEAADPRVRVTYLPLMAEPGHTLALFVMPRIDPAICFRQWTWRWRPGQSLALFWSADGSLIAAKMPGTGSLGDTFVQAQFLLHSGRILGLPSRILISSDGPGGCHALYHRYYYLG